MQATLLTIQETIMKLQENMTKNHGEMKTQMEEVKKEVRKDIQKLDEKVGQIQEVLQKNEQRLQTIEKRMEKTERKLELADERMQERYKEVENSLIQLEMERASFYLHFQNVVETKEEDLTDMMAETIAETLQREKSEIINELDEVYRVYTNYARRFRLPKEVHIRFARKKVSDIISLSREEPMTYKGKEIITLKQIPKRVQEQRKDYHFLAARLNKNNILFRWITPEGMLVSWQGKKVKIDTLEKAKEFYAQLLGTEELSSSTEELESASQDHQQLEKNGTEQEEEERKKEGRPQEENRIRTRAQTEARNYRN
ncbi:transmembrane and coiled-coil domain-containing protein 5B-like [Notechis scutatus]|uniref:Transmembrane and coiled-coil domain-containing protein 5B-like n=1 Tax=Notechis scutatus TaxID=8663 RepID=A0A6J1W0C5_9SAUR|nr:transmembrane and coiled-coil domain-containing protein 5B-like [Notechis scutatus]